MRARQGAVLDVLNDPNPAGAAGGGFAKHVMAAQGCEGKIIGKGGETIRELCARTGAKIQIDKEDASVTIQGRQEQVDAAVAAVRPSSTRDPTTAGRAAAEEEGTAGTATRGRRPGTQTAVETHQSPEGYTYYCNTVTGSEWDQRRFSRRATGRRAVGCEKTRGLVSFEARRRVDTSSKSDENRRASAAAGSEERAPRRASVVRKKKPARLMSKTVSISHGE